MCEIEANADVTGTGIRASIYALCIASSVLKTLIRYVADQRTFEDFGRTLDSALQLQGLALLCTAIYQTFRNQLTLFHAICVLHLLSLLGLGLTSRGKYGHKGRIRRMVLLATQLVIAATFLAFVAYIWITAPRFGSQPECNSSTVYVVFFVSINATNTVFRYTILALMAAMVIGILISMAVFGTMAACLCGVRLKRQALKPDDIATLKSIFMRARFKDKGIKWIGLQNDIGLLVLRTLINVYGIVMLEQTILRNNLGADERKWGFGQVIAIFLLLGVAAELLNIFLAKIDSRMNQNADEETAGVAQPIADQSNRTASGTGGGPTNTLRLQEGDAELQIQIIRPQQ